MIELVTITGADDSIKPHKLLELSDQFPGVEWGILVSKSSAGTKRFPSANWIRELAWLASRNLSRSDLNLSVHLCGSWVRQLVAGKSPIADPDFPSELVKMADRMQLNFHAEKMDFSEDFVDIMSWYFPNHQIIVQMDDVNDHILGTLSEVIDAAPLFDTSHGAGVLRENWPAPIPHLFCGYAGGLGPDNLADQIPLIMKAAGNESIWIDMETRVRSQSDAVFDLDKVTKCLEIAHRYIDVG
jgi:hypothetical protein